MAIETELPVLATHQGSGIWTFRTLEWSYTGPLGKCLEEFKREIFRIQDDLLETAYLVGLAQPGNG